MKRHTAIAIAITASLAAAGCGSDAKTSAGTRPPATAATSPASTAASTAASTPPASTPPATSPAGTPASGGTVVRLVDSTLGTILADAQGRTLYVFLKDSAGASACTGGCATAWPPLAGSAAPGAGLDAEDFATITRDDGTQQVTFYGHPLYTFANDKAPGDVTGQGQNNVWYVVGSDGNPIQTAASIPGY